MWECNLCAKSSNSLKWISLSIYIYIIFVCICSVAVFQYGSLSIYLDIFFFLTHFLWNFFRDISLCNIFYFQIVSSVFFHTIRI